MLLLVLFGAVLVAGAYYLSKNKKPQQQISPTIPSFDPFTPLGAFEDPYYRPATYTDVYYYPQDQVPPMLQKTQGVLPYNEYFGCPNGYVPQQWYKQGGGIPYTGTPGMIRPLTYCQLVSMPYEDPYAYPLGDDNSSAFLQWAARNSVLTNYMIGMDNTITPSTVFENRFSIRPVIGGDIQYGGTGRLPNPIQYPSFIGY